VRRLPVGEPPGLPSLPTQTIGDRCLWKACEVSQPFDPQLGQLFTALGTEREKMEGQRRKKELCLLVVDDESASSRSDARGCQRCETPLSHSYLGLPNGSDGVERPLHSSLHSPREPFDSASLEIGTARLGRLHRQAGLFEPAQDPLPLRLDAGRIPLDQVEIRAGCERLGEPHSRAHPRLLGRACAWTDERPLSRRGCESDRCLAKLRPIPESGPQCESWNVQACDHGNVCSTRTHVLLSSKREVIPSAP
jgi:hypothetical protein